MEKVSICIPVYEMNGHGITMFNTLLDSVEMQTYSNIQVVVSDHSKDKIFKDVCINRNMDIKYLEFNDKPKNGPANTNNCLLHADGEIIKTIFQDDFLLHEYSIESMVSTLQSSGNGWLACGCWHTGTDGQARFQKHIPIWGGMDEQGSIESYMRGNHKIGGPSVVMFKNEGALFDENLVMLMDHSFYYKLGKKFGAPYIVEEPLMVVRIWPGSISSTVGYGIIPSEKEYMLREYK